MKTILAAIDFSRFSGPVIQYAVRFAQQFNARLRILHVVTFPRDSMYGAAATKSANLCSVQSASARSQIEQLVPPGPVEWQSAVRHGDPIEEIVRECDEADADLVMVASHGISGWKRMLLGSVVEHLAHSLTQPLLVIRGVKSIRASRIEEPARVLISCDISTGSRALVDLALSLASAFGAELHLAHAAEAPLNETVLDPTSGPYGEVQQALQERLHQCLRGWLPADAAALERIHSIVLQGMPGEELLAYARSNRINLIVVGVRSHNRVEKWLIGSTTESLLRHAPCPVVTVPLETG